MPLTWTQMKLTVEAQAQLDPQRAKLSERAWQAVEAGLQHLQGAGYNFEICPRGTMGELEVLREPQQSLPLPLSVRDAQALLAKPKEPLTSKFDSMTKAAPAA